MEVNFERAVEPLALRIFENFNPGAVVRIEGWIEGGQRTTLWEGRDPLLGARGSGVVVLPLDSRRAVSGLRLSLATERVAGWNEIDAVALHGLDGSLQWASRARASSSAAEGEAPQEPRALVDSAAPLPARGRTAVDGLLELLARVRDPKANKHERARLQELSSALATEILELQRQGSAQVGGWSGVWKTTFGLMRLEQTGEEVLGIYSSGASSQLVGRVQQHKLSFHFQEAEVRGEGWFELAPDGHSFAGKWRVAGEGPWRAWSGERRVTRDEAHTSLLCVLEAPWQESFDSPEFSFGGMLEAIFARSPKVRFRQRAVHGERDFLKWAGDLVYVDEPIVLVIASHATPAGLLTPHGLIDAQVIAQALGKLPNLVLVHFSACAAMAGELPSAVLAARHPSGALAGVSGYGVNVDWMASALVEFLYLDLVLNRGLDPGLAAAQVLGSVKFAGDEPSSGAIPETHFEFRAATGR